MSYTSEEFRILNNLAVMLDLGWDILTAVNAIRDDVTDADTRAKYGRLIALLEGDVPFGDAASESRLVTDAAPCLILRAGQSSGMLQERLGQVAKLVRFRFQGGWDPYQRFIETWAVLVECGISLEDAMTALAEDFRQQPLGDVAHDILAGLRRGESIHRVAEEYPDYFSKQAVQLIRYGERKNMARTLRSLLELV